MVEVKIYIWTYCPYCKRAMSLLDKKQVEYEKIVLDDKEEELNQLREQTGQRSVPQIFIGDEFIGGCDNLYELDSQGKLDELLSK